jgi:hypothetical protein
MKYLFALLLFVFCLPIDAMSQISYGGVPQSFRYGISNDVSYNAIQYREPALNRNAEKLPAIAGFATPVNIDANNEGEWTIIDHKTSIWRLGLQVENAESINLYLKDLTLSEGDKLFIYDSNRSKTLGAFTSENNAAYFPTEFIRGNQLIIELNTVRVLEEIPFEIAEVGVSPAGKDALERGFGDSDFCEVQVNCPEGNSWQSEKRGVARILVKEGATLFWCTGSLINNTKQDQTPYMLTAMHCGEDATTIDYLGWLFYFNFEADDCAFPTSEPVYQSMEGATLKASSLTSTNSGSDFKLIMLNDDVPKEYQPFYNGWDWSGEAASGGVSIHHPEGDIKMISTYTEPLLSTNYNNPAEDPDGKYWKVLWSETTSGHGVTEGGSSGAPIFSEEGLIVGALSGGKAACNASDQPDYYGKFSYSWASGDADSSRQLQPWLDPGNSAEKKLLGLDPDTAIYKALFSANTTQIGVGERVTFINQSVGDFTGYEWHFEGGTPDESEMEIPPSVTYETAGDYDVMLVAKTESITDTLLRRGYISVLPSLAPNPSSGKFRINFGGALPDELDVQVTDMTGRNVNYFLYSEEEYAITIDLSTQSSGLYLIRLISDGNEKVVKAMVISHTNVD